MLTVDPRLPNFFILGAAKAGTTSLYRYMQEHPEIYLSSVKEPQFFSHDEVYGKGMRYYLDVFFKGSERFSKRGEATPQYLYFEKVAKRLAETLPDDCHRFIVIVRDPVKRAYSLYWNMVAEGLERLSFKEALLAENERSKDAELVRTGSVLYKYVDSGMYAKQIRRYLKYFKLEQFLFLLFEDLKSNPNSILPHVYHFLGVKPIAGTMKTKVCNPAGMPRLRSVHNFVRSPSWAKKQAGRFLPQRLKYRIAKNLIDLNKRPFDYPEIDVEVEEMLRRKFRNDVLELQRLIGRSLEDWLPSN